MQRPLVTIALPVYNGERYLRESIESVLAQTYRPLEILLLDDASTDTTPEIAAEYADRLKIVRHPRNLGQFGNVNSGIAMARGEYISVCHADDVYDPDIVAIEADYLSRNPEVGAVFCQDRFIDADGREYGRLRLPEDIPLNRGIDPIESFDLLLSHRNRFLRTPGAMVRAAVYDAVGGYREVPGGNGDFDMWLRLTRRTHVTILDAHLYSYRHFHGSVGQAYQAMRTEPELFFDLMDARLAGPAGSHASPAALAAYEAHRSEDFLFCAINRYIKGDTGGAREMVGRIRAADIMGSRKVQRFRLMMLLGLMRLVARLPRIPALARAFVRRWHARGAPART